MVAGSECWLLHTCVVEPPCKHRGDCFLCNDYTMADLHRIWLSSLDIDHRPVIVSQDASTVR